MPEQDSPQSPESKDNSPNEWDKLLSGEDDGLTDSERIEAAAVRQTEYPDSLLIKNYKEAEENVRQAQEAGDGESSRYWQEQLGKYAKEMSPEALREARGY